MSRSSKKGRKHREDAARGYDKVEILSGPRVVLEAVRAGTAEKVYLKEKSTHDRDICRIEEDARRAGIPVSVLSGKELGELAGEQQGTSGIKVAATAAPCQYCSVDLILKEAQVNLNKAQLGAQQGENRKGMPLILVLDHLEDPHNLGAVIRTAEGVGVAGIIIPRDRAAGVTPAVRKVSAGAAEWLKIARVTNLARTLDELKKEGCWVYGADPAGKTPFYQSDWQGMIALVLGAEARGLSRLVREKCDVLLSIPMAGRVNSLNVSVAAGVLLYHGAAKLQSER